MVELVFKFDEKYYCECLKKVSRSLKYDSNFFCIHIHNYNIYKWTPQPITLPHSSCACGVMNCQDHCTLEEYVNGEDSIPVCMEFDSDRWDESFLSHLEDDAYWTRTLTIKNPSILPI